MMIAPGRIRSSARGTGRGAQPISAARQGRIAAWAALAALAGCLLGACGGAEGEERGGTASFDLSAVSADPQAYEGPSTATVADSAITPITDAPNPELPATVVDAQGSEVTVTDVSRILALDIYGTTSRIVFSLGLGPNVVGRDTSSAFPEIKDLPRVTPSGNTLSAEAILELAPSVIITDTSLGPWDVLLQIREAGVPVVVVDSHRSIESNPTLIQQVADALGVSADGARLAQRTSEEVAAATQTIAQAAPADDAKKLRMMFLYLRGSAGVYYVFGADSGVDSLITALGGVDVATEVGWVGMQPVTDEGLVSMNPDLILVMTRGIESVGGVDGLLERFPAVAATPAGAKRRVVDMDDSQMLAFGPSTPAVLTALAQAIYAPGSAG
ncbi:MAG: ABC transporter substrate-binding protein [Bifidobacteriaceae bacterium]|jgi:iron complex transport system substrate-binding protein|nr:ABC transporter substrate-binding protein [Bifidobacteriaceae bacterium]